MVVIKPDSVILSLFDADGNWTGPAERVIFFNGEMINIDDYAEQNGITWPDSGD